MLRGDAGADILRGGDGNDNLDGGTDSDVDILDGGDGDDVVVDRNGLDNISGGAGNDTIGINIPINSGWAGGGSVSAGDGNDFVRLTNDSTSATYFIDLGAGDDVLRLENNPAGPVTLGPGRDTIEWASSMPQGVHPLIITDFTPGDTGDVLDLALLARLADNPSTSPAAGALNPFAAGYFELRQNGSEVDLYFYRNGVADAQGSQNPVVRFLNTTLSQFTAANFGGADPHADPVSSPNTSTMTIISGTLTVDHGVVNHLQNILTGYQFDPFAASTFVNHGDVAITMDATLLLPPTGIATIAGTPPPAIVNASDGVFTVRSLAPVPHGANDTFEVFGAHLGSGSFRNDGQFDVFAAGGTAYGVRSLNVNFTNTGSFTVTSGYDAYGVYSSDQGAFSNTGSITVHGDDFAIGVYIGNSRSGITNAGTIIASTDPLSPFASIGIYLSETSGPRAIDHYNSGTITADIAFMIENDHSTTFLGNDVLHNSGTINGSVILSFGDDVVANTGTINGDVQLGGGNDRYDGTSGQFSGLVEGGTGADILSGGNSDENLYGDAGEDIITGGGGNDFIEGGAGRDLLDGGSGVDVLAYDESLLGVTVDLAAGTASDGISVDIVTGFEDVIGSRFDDRIQGSAGFEILIGGGGNDNIDGGGGNDVIEGDAGDDDLAGGKGSDIFLFSIGDGADTVRDFAAGDVLEIHGYANATSITQVGANVLLALSAQDRITLLNTTVAAVQAATTYAPAPLTPIGPTRNQSILALNEDVIAPAGTTMTLTDPAPFNYRMVHYSGQGILLASTSDSVAPDFFNAGTFSYVDSGLRTITGITRDYGGYWSDDNYLVNQRSGSILIENLNGDAIGVSEIPRTWNLGSFSVISHGGDAWGFADLSSFVGTSDVGVFHNEGDVRIRATGHAVGIGQPEGSSSSLHRINNAGTMWIDGGLSSIGIEWKAQATPFSSGSLTNTGSIVVTDSTAAKDSAAVAVDWTNNNLIWNSGTLLADYAIKRANGFSGGPGNLSIYNSGSMLGDIDLLSMQDDALRTVTLVNNGTIVGDVTLTNSNDLFDSRGGSFSGTLNGYDGNDTLLTGAGSQILLGGFGDDLLSGGAGSDTLTGGKGADHFRFESGFGVDTITDFNGSQGDVIDVRGYSAWSNIAQVGSDVVVTFGANDRLVLQNQQLANITAAQFNFGAAAIAGNAIFGTGGIQGPPATPQIQIFGTSLADHLFGAAASDALHGAAGPDLINGGLGDDSLYGDEGNDALTGGFGFDTLTGGSGADTFIDTVAGLRGDTITDFGPGDRIVISDADIAGFTFSLTGNTLSFNGSLLTLGTPVHGGLVAIAAAGGGVELRLHDPANDFDGDGRSDLLWLNNSGQLTDWLGTSMGGFATNWANANMLVGSGWHVVATGDFDGDHRDDILWRSDGGTVTDWLATGSGGFVTNWVNSNASLPSDWHVAGAGDFNGDGMADILWRSDSGALVDWLATGRGGFSANWTGSGASIPSSWHVAGIGDFNGDGKADILWRDESGVTTDWLGNGSGFTTNWANAGAGVPTDWNVAATGDFNGDGYDDVLWRNDNGLLVNWLGNSNGGFAADWSHAPTGVGSEWSIAAVGDYNGDARDDILWRNINGQLAQWLGSSTGSFSDNSANISSFVGTSWHVVAHDGVLH